jgi:hypothetical protein
MGLWDDLYTTPPDQNQQAPFSKVDEFKKQQKDNTKVGKVEAAVVPKIASAIESGKRGPLGFVVNPAMRVMEALNERVIQPVTQGVSTGLLTGQALAAGKGAQSFRFAREQSKKISMGQALATPVGQAIGSVLPDAITPTFMDSNFDIFDERQRDQAFRDEVGGILASGVTDLTLAMIGTKGTGMAVRAGAKKVLGPSKIVTANDMNIFRTKTEEAVRWAETKDGTPAPSGLATLIDDAVKETNLTRLAANPLVSETSNPYRTATILSRLDNHKDVGDYLLAERGDTAAFTRLFQSKPFTADHLDNYGINRVDPLTDFTKISLDALDPKMTQRFQALIDAKKKTDKNFAAAMDDFMSKATAGVIESFSPGKFSAIESLQLSKKKLALQAKYGDLKLFGKDGNQGWRTQVYKSDTYDRAIRTIAYIGSGRPQGHINVSNPRRFEAASDLLSDLNRLQFLRGTEGSKFKRDMVEKFLDAQDNTQRAIALSRIEQQVMIKLANHYKVHTTGDIRTDKDAVARITEWHTGASTRRQTLKNYATKNGFIPDEDGNLNVTNFWSPTTEANTLPMLDFRKLEIEVITNTNRLAKGVSPITSSQLAGAQASRIGMGIGTFLDAANMVFNNLNLLRFAYIPKNSIVDPLARGSMALESMELFRNANKGAADIMYNTSLRLESARRFIPGSPGARSRRMEKDIEIQTKKLADEMNPAVMAWEDAQKTYDKAEALWQSARKRQEKAAAAVSKASKANKPAATKAKHEADYVLFKAQQDFIDADDTLARTAEKVQGYATLIEKNRAKISAAVTRRGELKQRKYLGQESEVIEVNGKKYTIAGLADPNIRGANAYMSEVDSASNFYSTGMQSEISRKLRADGARFVTIKRSEGKPYWNALAHIANRQIRNELDMPIGMMLRGDADADVLKWLYTGDAGKEYRSRMSSLAGKTLNKDDYAAWISSTNDKLRKMYPSQELRSTILERPVTIEEVQKLLENKPDLLETIDGPNINLNDLNAYEKWYTKIIGAPTDAAWRLLSASENRMVRNPMFLSYTRDELKTLINAAQRSGIDVTDALVNNQLRQVAYRNALSRVEQTLYSSRRLTNGMYAARFAMSFPLAFFNSQAVALRLMAKNPMNAYWYNSIQQAFDNFEAYEDKDGNTYKKASDVPAGVSVTVKYPLPLGNKLPKWAKDALRPYTDSRGGGLRWNPKQLEFMIADPSVSWFGTVAVSELVKNGFNFGPWKMYGEDIAKTLRTSLGDDFYENSVLYGGYPTEGANLIATVKNTVLPGYLQSILDGTGITKSDRFLDEVFTSYRSAYSEWDRNGRIGEPPTMETAAKAAGNMAFIRATSQFFAPIATTFDPVTRAATSYYADLLKANGGDYDAAQKQMEAEWGIDSLALIGSNQKNVGGLAATQQDIKMLRKNPELLTKLARSNPKFATMLSSGYGDLAASGTNDDSYSTEIAAIYKGMNFPGTLTKLTTKKTDLEIQQDIEARRGWAEYNKAKEWQQAMMYQYGIRSTQEVMYERTGISQEFDRMVSAIGKDFPGWVTDRNSSRTDFWTQSIPAIETIANNEAWRIHADSSNTKWQEIAYWLENAKQFKSDMDQRMITEQRKNELKVRFSQFHYDFLQEASDEFAAFATRWLDNMPELSRELVIDNG